MRHLVLYRYNIAENSTSGVLHFDSKFLCHSLENSHTLIDTGIYELRLSFSPKWTERLGTSILEVVEPGTDTLGERDQILIHPANRYDQLRGCIAPGDIASNELNNPLVGLSVRAYNRLYEKITEAMTHTTVVFHVVERMIPITGEVT